MAGWEFLGRGKSLTVSPRLVDLVFELCFNAKLNAKHFSTSDVDLGKKALQSEELEAKIHEGPVEVNAEQFT